jgi:two-component system response regulator DesR
MNTIRIFLVDDEPQVRHGLRMRLEMEADFAVVGEADDGPGAIRGVSKARPDVVLMDIEMPGKDGIRVTTELRNIAPACAVVIVSLQDDPATKALAFAAGAAAFVGKHEIDAALTQAIRSTACRLHAKERLYGWIGGTSADQNDADTDEREETR